MNIVNVVNVEGMMVGHARANNLPPGTFGERPSSTNSAKFSEYAEASTPNRGSLVPERRVSFSRDEDEAFCVRVIL